MVNEYGRIKIKFGDLLFHMALIIYLSYQFWESTLYASNIDVSIPRIAVFLIVTSLLFSKFLRDRKYNKFFVFLIILIAFSWVGYNVSNLRELILTVLFIYEARNVDFRKILVAYISLLTVYSVITILASVLGFFSVDTISVVSSFGAGERQRNNLGFYWVTYGPNIFMTIVLAWVYLKKRIHKHIITVIVLLVINVLYYISTDTRAVFAEIILLLVLAILANYKKYHVARSKFVQTIITLSFAFMAIISILLTLGYYRFTWIQSLNNILSNRLFYSAQAFIKYPISLFGNIIKWNMVGSAELGYFYVDSSYIQILLQYGIVVFVVILVLFSALMHSYQKSNDIVGVICLFVIAIHSITDPQLFLIMYNPFVLEIGKILLENKKRE